MKLDALLDASGLSCPLPLLKTKTLLRQLPAGARIRVIATDPTAQDDFVAFAQITSHRLLGMYQLQQQYFFILECG